MTTTRIVNADLVIAYDADEDTHVYRRDCDVVFDEARIVHVGPGYQGAADATIDGRGFMVMPGLVNVHSHPGSEPGNKGLTDEVGSPKLYNTSLYEYLWLFRADAEGIPHTNRMAWSELLMSGVTTLVDLSSPSEGWIDRAAEVGTAAGAGTDVPQRALVHEERLHGRVRSRRCGRAQGHGCGAGRRRCRRQASRAGASAASSARRRSTPARKG